MQFGIPETVQVYLTDVLFDLGIAGNVLSWMASGNGAAADANHRTYLIGAEQQVDLVYFVYQQTIPTFTIIANSVGVSGIIAAFSLLPTRTYRIVVTTPGPSGRIDLYIDGVFQTFLTIPSGGFLTTQIIPFIELANWSPTSNSLATMDGLGGMFD